MLTETRRPMVCVAEACAHALGDVVENAVADGSAVQQPVIPDVPGRVSAFGRYHRPLVRVTRMLRQL